MAISAPVLISRQSSTTFSDKEQIWADNASTSPFFGTTYVCWASFVGQEKGKAAPDPIKIEGSSAMEYEERVLGIGTDALVNKNKLNPDILTGSSGMDWFFVGLGDSVTDRHNGEELG